MGFYCREFLHPPQASRINWETVQILLWGSTSAKTAGFMAFATYRCVNYSRYKWSFKKLKPEKTQSPAAMVGECNLPCNIQTILYKPLLMKSAPEDPAAAGPVSVPPLSSVFGPFTLGTVVITIVTPAGSWSIGLPRASRCRRWPFWLWNCTCSTCIRIRSKECGSTGRRGIRLRGAACPGVLFCLEISFMIGFGLFSLLLLVVCALLGKREISFIHLRQEALSIIWHFDNSLPSQQISVCIASLQVAHILLLIEEVLAEHESPDSREILLVFHRKTGWAMRMIKVNQLHQPMFIFGIGSDASWYLGEGPRWIWEVCECQEVVLDAVTQGTTLLMDTIAKCRITCIAILHIDISHRQGSFEPVLALPDCAGLDWRHSTRTHSLFGAPCTGHWWLLAKGSCWLHHGCQTPSTCSCAFQAIWSVCLAVCWPSPSRQQEAARSHRQSTPSALTRSQSCRWGNRQWRVPYWLQLLGAPARVAGLLLGQWIHVFWKLCLGLLQSKHRREPSRYHHLQGPCRRVQPGWLWMALGMLPLNRMGPEAHTQKARYCYRLGSKAFVSSPCRRCWWEMHLEHVLQ